MIEAKAFTKVKNIEIPEIFYRRLKTGDENWDEIFGTGILPGSVATLTAPAGAGKSTFCYQLSELLAQAGYKVGYASDEESIYQMAFTCDRLGVEEVDITNEIEVEKLCESMKDYDFLVIDSFQKLKTKDKMNRLEKQEYCADLIVESAKANECAVIIIMHLTKDGKLKGSSYVPHMVDLNVEILKDKEIKNKRIISIYKNRFGCCEDFESEFNGNGHKIIGVHTVEDSSSSAETKIPLSVQREKVVLEMQEPPHITMGRVMKELDIQRQTAYLLLKGMEDKKLITKYGRGDDAVWKIQKVEEKKKEKLFDI